MYAGQFEDESIAVVEEFGDIERALMIAQQGRTILLLSLLMLLLILMLILMLLLANVIAVIRYLLLNLVFVRCLTYYLLISGVKLLEHPDHLNSWSIRYCAGNDHHHHHH